MTSKNDVNMTLFICRRRDDVKMTSFRRLFDVVCSLGDSDEDCVGLVVVNEVLLSPTSNDKKNKWIVDSGATSHMCNDIKQFENVKELKEVQKIKVGDGYFVI